MKKIAKGSVPTLLQEYQIKNPNATWNRFIKRVARKKQLHNQLYVDQGGLCAYCEIDLKPASNELEEADFRVEHFHPKSDTTSSSDNWHLKWDNLFACCHGGSEKKVADASKRFEKEPQERTCDIPKEDTVLDNIILNPLDLDAFPNLFLTDRYTGKLTFNSESKSELLVSANRTIDKLRLNSPRLSRLRAAVLDEINTVLLIRLKSGAKIDEVLNELAQSQLLKRNDQWPAFFSSIRSYLGDEAEKVLKTNGYKG